MIRFYLFLILSLFASSVFATLEMREAIFPVLRGDGGLYASFHYASLSDAEIERSDSSYVYSAIMSIESLMLSAKRNDKVFDESFVDKFGQKVILPKRRVQKLRELYSTINSVEYKNVVRWGEYLHFDLIYNLPGREMRWREDVICHTLDHCSVVQDVFQQEFEIPYAFFIESMKKEVVGKHGDNLGATFSINTGVDPSGTNKDEYPIQIFFNPISLDSSVCVSCESVGVKDGEEGILSSLVAFLVTSSEVGEQLELKKYLSGYSSDFRENVAFEWLVWDGDDVNIHYLDYVKFVQHLSVYERFDALGYIGDGEFVYLFVNFKMNDNDLLGVLTLKKGNDGNYFLYLGENVSLSDTFIHLPSIIKLINSYYRNN